VAGLHDALDLNERRKALLGQIEEMKRQNRVEQLERRLALEKQHDEMRHLRTEERADCKNAIGAQIEELKQLHLKQQERRKALDDQLKEINRLQTEGRQESKRSLREQIVEKVELAREEHVRKHHSASMPEFQFPQGDTELRKGFLKQHILLALTFRPAHGYELMHLISHHTGHAWTPSPGSMYPALESLESKGFIASRGDGRRKVYSLTPKGDDIMARMKKKREEQFLEMKAFMSALFDE
jgi:DNA-binding PadR family transcriptional regulator